MRHMIATTNITMHYVTAREYMRNNDHETIVRDACNVVCVIVGALTTAAIPTIMIMSLTGTHFTAALIIGLMISPITIAMWHDIGKWSIVALIVYLMWSELTHANVHHR